MSELEHAEREFQALATRLIYDSFERKISPSEQRQLDELSDRVSELSAPNFLELAGC